MKRINMFILLYLLLQMNSFADLFVNPEGNVGIGTVLPTSMLEINSNDTKFITFKRVGNLKKAHIGYGTVNDGGIYLGTEDNQYSLWVQQNGNIGIGTTTPSAKLHISGYVTNKDNHKIAAILSSSYNNWVHFGGSKSGRIRGSNEGYLVVDSYPTGTNNRLYLNLSSSGDVAIAYGGGNVGIGIIFPSHKLHVNGNIKASSFISDTKTYADFVFKPDYNLKSLNDVEQFIKNNGHLPDIPSEKEALKNGIDLTEMNVKLLQKIEELTLYSIDQEKRIQDLENKLDDFINK